MKFFNSLLVITALGLPVYAEPPSAQSVNILLTVTKAEALVDSVLASTGQLMRKALLDAFSDQKLTAPQQRVVDDAPAKFAQIMREEMSWEKVRPLQIQIYTESFTQDEIDGLIAFYKSPAGVAFVNKMPLVAQKSVSLLQSLMSPAMDRMTVLVRQTMAEVRDAK